MVYERFTLSKKLRRRIHELCGFNDLSHDEVHARAAEILDSAELKQAICGQILGTSHRDVEKSMLALLTDRGAHNEEDKDQVAVPTQATIDAIVPKKKKALVKDRVRYRTYTPEEVQWLMEAGNKPVVATCDLKLDPNYPTYSEDFVSRLVKEHLEYQEAEKRKREKLWATTTTASAARIDPTTKRKSSTNP